MTTPSYRGTFIPKIAQARRRNGFTQVSMAEKLGITKRTMTNIEQGHTLPNVAVLFALSDVLNVPWTSLYEYERGGEPE